MSIEKLIGILVLGLMVFSSLFAVFLIFTDVLKISAEEVHSIIEIDNSSIYIEDNTFYIIGPEDKPIKFDPNGDMFDFTHQSTVYVKFTKRKPNFLYEGSDWTIDGIVKVDNQKGNSTTTSEE